MSENTRRGMRLQYVAGVLVLLASLLIAFIADDASPTPSVAEYYSSLESRIGYWFFLGNTRHCGLYSKGTFSPFPISTTQRAMKKNYTHNVKKNRLGDKIQINFADYHNLSTFPAASFNRIYIMETFAHANNPDKVLRNFHHLLKPRGILVLHKADFSRNSEELQDVLRLLLMRGGFRNIKVKDLTDEVLPMWRLFGVVGYVPYQMFQLLGVRDRFINAMAGVETWLNWDIFVRAVKP
ncbi:hypothetical protein P154DRAFT_542815 [Amniculicola lignicola CBS 123094]|uniref:Methyltransferase type 11 domain-containing protein n=1 Tax=Amniculicola lignicola CBS 123094 TaxID=1392246 RepID=A0A6A5X2A0_9PLEO|nr:hypothetical protein P154DRAFT_542815 [Amniculicola lignicola CBS 123094]